MCGRTGRQARYGGMPGRVQRNNFLLRAGTSAPLPCVCDILRGTTLCFSPNPIDCLAAPVCLSPAASPTATGGREKTTTQRRRARPHASAATQGAILSDQTPPSASRFERETQTGSGKTFTTFGPGAVMENHLNPSDPKSYALRGLVPRVLEYLYANIARRVDNGGGKVREAGPCV